jgi:hypothetical protein
MSLKKCKLVSFEARKSTITYIKGLFICSSVFFYNVKFELSSTLSSFPFNTFVNIHEHGPKLCGGSPFWKILGRGHKNFKNSSNFCEKSLKFCFFLPQNFDKIIYKKFCRLCRQNFFWRASPFWNFPEGG